MKQRNLLAKTLALGLAVATAATSMGVPGGLLTPITAYAETSVSSSNDTLTSVGVNGKLYTASGDTSYTWYRVDGDASVAGALLVTGDNQIATGESYAPTIG
jgi:hypothetical protein